MTKVQLTSAEACAILGLDKVAATVPVPEGGAIFGLGISSSYRAAARGELPAIRIGGRLSCPTVGLALKLLGRSQAPADGDRAA